MLDPKNHFTAKMISEYETKLAATIRHHFRSVDVEFDRKNKQVIVILEGGLKVELAGDLFPASPSDSINSQDENHIR